MNSTSVTTHKPVDIQRHTFRRTVITTRSTRDFNIRRRLSSENPTIFPSHPPIHTPPAAHRAFGFGGVPIISRDRVRLLHLKHHGDFGAGVLPLEPPARDAWLPFGAALNTLVAREKGAYFKLDFQILDILSWNIKQQRDRSFSL